MSDEAEDLEVDLEQLAAQFESEIREDIEEAAAVALCFPATEAGNHCADRLKNYAKAHPGVHWRWVSEKFPEQKLYWEGELEKAMRSTQPESDDSE